MDETDGSCENEETLESRKKEHSENSSCSVIEGGTIEGWTKLSSVILWKRILGILGNVNDVRDPEIHANIYKHLIELWQMLEVVSIHVCILLWNAKPL